MRCECKDEFYMQLLSSYFFAPNQSVQFGQFCRHRSFSNSPFYMGIFIKTRQIILWSIIFLSLFGKPFLIL